MIWKALVGLVLLVAAAVGGVTLYIRSEVKTALEDATSALSPVAEMRYASVSVTLRGTIRVQDIELRPRAFNDPLHIEGLEVETPGLWFLLTGKTKLRDGNLPEHLRVTLRGLAFKLDGPMGASLDRFMAAAAQSSGVPPMRNCGDVRYFDLNAYQRLGYPSFVFDVSLGYRFEKGGGPLRMTVEWRMRDLGVATANFEFVGASPSRAQAMGMQARLRTFDVVYEDQSFIDRLKRYCTKASGMSVEQYIESEVNRNASVYQKQVGFVPGPGLSQAYREFLTRPGKVHLQVKPSVELDIEMLRQFKPEDMASMLNLRVSVNGKAVTDLSMVQVSSAPTRLMSPPSAAPGAVTNEFRAVPAADLDRHVGKTVRVHLTQGGTREGRLVQVIDRTARVERRLAGGRMTLAIPFGQIERVEVLL